MIYQKILPSEQLAPFVKCYYHWEHALDHPTASVIQSPPTGYEAIVFNYKNPYRISSGVKEAIPVPQAFYSGQNTVNFQLHLQGAIEMFGIVFLPAAFATLFRISVKNTFDQRIALDDMLGLEGKYLIQQMLEADTLEKRVKSIECFLLQKLWLYKLHTNVANNAAYLIDNRMGLVTVQQLLHEIGSSRRVLERQFVEKVGVSPKFYARIRRFSYISYRLIYHQDDWQELIYKGGYVDQSHFIKDFQFFNRQKPTNYLRQHQELVKYVK